MLEQLKQVSGYPDYYVSTWGRVFHQVNNKMIELHGEDHKGYRRVNLFKDHKRKHFDIHRLVAAAFLDNPENKPEVNHIDGNKSNNSVTNLEYVTHQENADHFSLLHTTIKNENTLFPEFDSIENILKNKQWIKEGE